MDQMHVIGVAGLMASCWTSNMLIEVINRVVDGAERIVEAGNLPYLRVLSQQADLALILDCQ